MTSEHDSSPDPGDARRLLEAERVRLQEIRDPMAAALAGESERDSLGELSGADQHPADAGTETFNREQDVSIVESVAGELSDVEAALKKLDDGTYGRCEACGRPIAAERLQALPAARFCLEDAELASAAAAPGVVPVRPPGLEEGQRPI